MNKTLTRVGILLAVSGLMFGVLWYRYRTQLKLNTPLERITVQLKWLHQSQFAGHYVADKKGWYKDAGMEVQLLPFDYTHLPIEEVLKGNAQFGVTGADEILIAREKGKPVIALAVIYQENPVVAYALTSSGISKPVDLIGKTIGMESGINVETIIHAMLSAQGIDWKKSLKEVPIGYDADPLIKKQVDVATGYVTNEPILAEEAGHSVTIIAPHQYGVKLYADVLFTTEEMIAKRPELVRAFVTTTLRGWEYALDHVDESVSYTLQYPDPNNKALNTLHQTALLTRSIPYIKPSTGQPVGQMTFVEWKKTHTLLKEYGVLTQNQDITKVFTTDFLR